MLKCHSLKICAFVFLLLNLVACGSEKNSVSQSATNESTVQNPLSPGNLPPPNATAQNISGNEGVSFFERKKTWDSFSPQLKEKIISSYSKKDDKQGLAYDTLFGKVIVENKPEVVVLEEQGELHSQIFADTAALPADGPCSTGATFMCISTPHDRDGVVTDVLNVNGAFKMNDLAYFGQNDPIAMISVFKQVRNSPLQRAGEYPLLLSDLNVSTHTSAPAMGGTGTPASVDVGAFQKVVPLNGPGVYQVIISAWMNTEREAALVTQRYTIYRQSIPLFFVINGVTNGVKIYPADRHATPRCDKDHPITLSATPVSVNAGDVCIEAELREEGTPNVGVVVENYSRDANNNLVLNYSGSGAVETGTNSSNNHPVVTTLVPLNAGFNHFRVKVQNSMLMGTISSDAQREFDLMGALRPYSVKMISTAMGGKIIETQNENNSIPLQFCITADGSSCVTDWPDSSKPVVVLNSIAVNPESIAKNSVGHYSTTLNLALGTNTLNIQVPTANGHYVPEYKNTFGVGKVNKLYDNGQLKETDNFLKRGLSLNLSNELIRNDLKKILANFLNTADFKSSMASAFKSDDTSPRTACTETFYNDHPGQTELTVDSGDTSIEFLEEGFRVGDFVINRISSSSNNRLELDVVLKGLHGEANLRGLRLPVQVSVGGRDASFIPISVSISELRIKIAVKFQKNSQGVQELQIERLSNDIPAVEIIGDDAFGKYLHVNSNRNPLVASLEQFEQQSGAFSMQFRKGVESSILCGVETKLNHQTIGLAKWFSDLPKIVSYNNQNPFRAAMQFSMLGKQVGLDIAYDVLHADAITMNAQGIHINNIPLRFNPGPVSLANVPSEIKNALVGSLSRPDLNPEPSAAAPDLDEHHSLGLAISEDALNQALFAASFAGLLDIDVDPNFFTNNGIPFIKQVTPTTQDLVFNANDRVFLDLNQNGVNDDANLPILMRLRTDKTLAPQIHFLSQAEIDEMAVQVNKKNNTDSTEAANRISLNTTLKYFKFTIPNLEISVYQVQPYPASLDGYQTVCSVKKGKEQKSETLDNIMIAPIIRKGGEAFDSYGHACKQTLSVDYVTTLNARCPSDNYESFTTPSKNGAIISAIPGMPNVPLLKYQASITLYGVLQGVFREQRLQDKWTIQQRPNQEAAFTAVANPPYTNFARIRFLSTQPYTPEFLLKVLENHTPIPNETLVLGEKIGNILSFAVSHECDLFNEVRIPLPDKFVDDPAVQGDFMESLKPFGIASFDLGDQSSEFPVISPDASGLYLDLSAHLGVGYSVILDPQVATDIFIQEILRQGNQH